MRWMNLDQFYKTLVIIPENWLEFTALGYIGLLLGLIDVVQSLHKLRTLLGNSMSRFSYF